MALTMSASRRRAAGCSALVLLAASILVQLATAQPVVDVTKRRVVVKFSGAATLSAAAAGDDEEGAFLQALLARASMQEDDEDVGVLEMADDEDLDGMMERLRGSASVEYVEQDEVLTLAVGEASGEEEDLAMPSADDAMLSAAAAAHNSFYPNDELVGQQWGLQRVQAEGAWQVERGSASARVCVIDTGVDVSHPDLAPNMDGPGTGWIMGQRMADAADDNGHGTHIAGIVGAVGVTGVSQAVNMGACKFLDAYGNGYMSDAVRCVRWCQNVYGASVIVASWGGSTKPLETLGRAIRAFGDKGGIFVAAALNFGTDLDEKPLYPAAFKLPNQLTVGGQSLDGSVGAYSCYGQKTVHLFAPGTDVLSTLPGGKYGRKTGTSMAAPHVAGAIALMQSAGQCSGVDCVGLVMSSVGRRANLKTLSISGGVLNVARAFGIERNWKCWELSCERWFVPGKEASFMPAAVAAESVSVAAAEGEQQQQEQQGGDLAAQVAAASLEPQQQQQQPQEMQQQEQQQLLGRKAMVAGR